MKTILFLILSIIALNCNAYKISERGKQFIKDHEKCSLVAYWDSNGYSIGYGHHTKAIKKNMKITQAQANKYFNEDIKQVEAAANRIINSLPHKYKFTQGFFDGLCSLIYNCGEYGVKQSEFYKRLASCRIKKGVINKNDLNFTIAAVKKCRISAPGHVQRRYNEHVLMLS